jgi:hypothetical protein
MLRSEHEYFYIKLAFMSKLAPEIEMEGALKTKHSRAFI